LPSLVDSFIIASSLKRAAVKQMKPEAHRRSVDLPGYQSSRHLLGCRRRSQKALEFTLPNACGFLKARSQDFCCFLCIDSDRHPR
jgi:hypothetical protein